MNTPQTARIGSVSQATLRQEDLIPSFVTEIQFQMGRCNEYWRDPANEVSRARMQRLCEEAEAAFNEDATELLEDVDTGELLSGLIDALETFAPPYCYFGAHPGDGADFGFWPSMETIGELEHGTSEDSVGGDDCREVNDHGNVTVWSGGKAVLELV